jgi:hypothetical protein
MRRLDLRPRKKLRNPGRHLRQLAQWPDQIVTQLPSAEQARGEMFWNFKVPVFSKLVEPPHATPDMQRACVAAIFAAAEAVEKSDRRPKDCRVACLVTTPFLFQSEVTLFFSEDYFRSFLPRENSSRTAYEGGWAESGPADAASMGEIMPPAPEGLELQGGVWLRQFEEGWESEIESVTWVWSFARR